MTRQISFHTLVKGKEKNASPSPHPGRIPVYAPGDHSLINLLLINHKLILEIS